jgi:hypothetical protein
MTPVHWIVCLAMVKYDLLIVSSFGELSESAGKLEKSAY